jgi:serine/threonine protein kinase
MTDNAPTADDKKLIGTVIENRFVLEKILGRGGISTVYEAKHNRVDLTVAVKVLHTHYTDTEESVERFKREAIIINALNHPNIVHMISHGVLDGPRPYLVLEHLDGRGLDEILDEEQRLDEEATVKIIGAVVEGLKFAHDLGIVHRDIKPSNVMLVQKLSESDQPYIKGEVTNLKLLDFGIAKCQSQDQFSQKLTQPGYIFGSPLYMSPEQCMGNDIGIPSDIYSLGCMFYEMLAGAPPLRGQSSMHTFAMHLYEMPPAFDTLATPVKVSPAVQEIIFKCLAKKPEQRYSSAHELSAAIADLSN